MLYIPHVGPLVAISGSVNTPAIYEMKDNSTLNDLIEIAGDLSTVADTNKITIDRFVDHQARKTLEFPYDDQSRALPLKDGDIVRVFSIVPRFEDTVTLRGNVANPGRYPWKPGMRIRDLIPDPQALLTRRYWRDRAAIVNGRATEYPVSAEIAASARKPPAFESSSANGTAPSGHRNTGRSELNPKLRFSGCLSRSLGSKSGGCGALACARAAAAKRIPRNPASINRLDNQQPSQPSEDNPTNPNTVRDIAEDVRRYAPEINWDYAIIQRVNPVDLSSKLIWMSPRKAIIEHDEASNLELQPGDIITIFSQRDINVPQANALNM